MSNNKLFLNAAVLLDEIDPLKLVLGSSAPLTYVVAFLKVAANGDAGIDQSDLSKQVGLSQAATIRAVQALSEWSWLKDDADLKRPGLGLVTSEADPRGDARRRVVKLTNKGWLLMGKVGVKMEKARR